jgi:hypothetical protein
MSSNPSAAAAAAAAKSVDGHDIGKRKRVDGTGGGAGGDGGDGVDVEKKLRLLDFELVWMGDDGPGDQLWDDHEAESLDFVRLPTPAERWLSTMRGSGGESMPPELAYLCLGYAGAVTEVFGFDEPLWLTPGVEWHGCIRTDERMIADAYLNALRQACVAPGLSAAGRYQLGSAMANAGDLFAASRYKRLDGCMTEPTAIAAFNRNPGDPKLSVALTLLDDDHTFSLRFDDANNLSWHLTITGPKNAQDGLRRARTYRKMAKWKCKAAGRLYTLRGRDKCRLVATVSFDGTRKDSPLRVSCYDLLPGLAMPRPLPDGTMAVANPQVTALLATSPINSPFYLEASLPLVWLDS